MTCQYFTCKDKASIETSSKGFTLVEVILALALTAMLLGLLSTGVYVVSEDWNRNSDVLDKSLDQALSILQIDRALVGAFPHSYVNEETLSREIFFEGERDTLRWASTVSPQRTPGLTVWELFSVAGEGVYLTIVPAFSDNPSLRLQEAEPILILPDYDVTFRYLFEELDESKLWEEEWYGSENLSLPLAAYVIFEPFREFENEQETYEIVAQFRNNRHRSIRPNTGLQGLQEQ